MPSVAEIKKELGNLQTGYGMMSLTWKAQPTPKEVAFESIHKVITLAQQDSHKAFLNVGEFYGPDRINLVYVREFFEKYPELRQHALISCKGAINATTMSPEGGYDKVVESVRNSVEAIGGHIEMFEVARLDKSICKDGEVYPYESFKALAAMIDEGLIDGISLSEVTEEEIRAIAKDWGQYLTCVEVELSMFSPQILENGVAKANAELGLVTICYSPLGRGLLTGQVRTLADIPEGDFRNSLERFHGDSLVQNLKLVTFLDEEIAAKRSEAGKASLAQIALGWIKHWSYSAEYPKGKFIPIPSGSTVARVNENFDESKTKITDDEFEKINNFLKTFTTAGDRYEMH